jgi:DNA-binding GntR family transcriptional regulator
MSLESVPGEVCRVFGCLSSTKIRCIKRVVQADQQPVIYVEDYLAPSLETVPMDWENYNGNMVEFLAARHSAQLHQIQSFIRAAAITADVSPCLELPEGTPVLSVRSTIYTVDNQPITYSHIYFNSNIVELNIIRMIQNN